jgi:hypothetical protein
MGWKKGECGNPAGRPKIGSRLLFDLRMAAKEYAPEALEVIARAMKSKDERVRLLAAQIMLDRGFGKPPITADVTETHKFAYAIVPETMDEETWLARRGQPLINGKATPLPPDAPTTLDRSTPDEDDPTKLN